MRDDPPPIGMLKLYIVSISPQKFAILLSFCRQTGNKRFPFLKTFFVFRLISGKKCKSPSLQNPAYVTACAILTQKILEILEALYLIRNVALAISQNKSVIGTLRQRA